MPSERQALITQLEAMEAATRAQKRSGFAGCAATTRNASASAACCSSSVRRPTSADSRPVWVLGAAL
jgi:hypothetical protein